MEGGNSHTCQSGALHALYIMSQKIVQPTGSGDLPACWSIHGYLLSNRLPLGELLACRSLHGTLLRRVVLGVSVDYSMMLGPKPFEISEAELCIIPGSDIATNASTGTDIHTQNP